MTPRDVPQEVVIEAAPGCNFSCPGCFNRASFASETRSIRGMSSEFIREVLGSVRSAGIPQVRFTGGEALSRPDIIELMEHARNLGLRVWLNTNATLVKPSNAARICSVADNILVQFNGHDEASDLDWTHTAGSFARKLRGVALLREAGARFIRAGTALTPRNLENLELIFKVVRAAKVDDWEVYRPVELAPGEVPLDVPTLVRKLAVLSVAFEKPVSIANPMPFCAGDVETLPLFCSAPGSESNHQRIFIDPRGFAKPSYYINEDLGDPRDILSCWNHPFMKKMRDLQMVPDACRSCAHLVQCRGGSRYAAFLHHGSYDARDPLMKS